MWQSTPINAGALLKKILIALPAAYKDPKTGNDQTQAQDFGIVDSTFEVFYFTARNPNHPSEPRHTSRAEIFFCSLFAMRAVGLSPTKWVGQVLASLVIVG